MKTPLFVLIDGFDHRGSNLSSMIKTSRVTVFKRVYATALRAPCYLRRRGFDSFKGPPGLGWTADGPQSGSRASISLTTDFVNRSLDLFEHGIRDGSDVHAIES